MNCWLCASRYLGADGHTGNGEFKQDSRLVMDVRIYIILSRPLDSITRKGSVSPLAHPDHHHSQYVRPHQGTTSLTALMSTTRVFAEAGRAVDGAARGINTYGKNRAARTANKAGQY